ncbi:STAS domain-containing protein [Pseudomonas entomophila]|uniref:STAS domain-containing protein n=1 Tax=Pseudomonas sp. RIT-PI-S TaxID=3035295 RepID=UPI0021D903E1
MITASLEGSVLQVTVQTDLTIYTALELHGALMPWLEQPCEWQLDLAEVSEVDGAGLQLLLALRQQVLSAGHPLRLAGCSPAVNEALALCGLAAAFDDRTVA